jgi:hypothetical protein
MWEERVGVRYSKAALVYPKTPPVVNWTGGVPGWLMDSCPFYGRRGPGLQEIRGQRSTACTGNP